MKQVLLCEPNISGGRDRTLVEQVADEIRGVAVMYLGKIMELADREELFTRPLHPYTQSLMSAVPLPNPKVERKRRRVILQGEVPSRASPPSGCVFHTRCPLAVARCSEEVPEYREVGPGHFASCHLIDSGGPPLSIFETSSRSG